MVATAILVMATVVVRRRRATTRAQLTVIDGEAEAA